MRPNILFIMSDDHASKAISAYGHGLNQTPNLDRIAQGGMRMDHCYVTNSICTPRSDWRVGRAAGSLVQCKTLD